jgi:hypothetical protein
VNIRTRDFPARASASFSLAAGMNASASFRDVLSAPTAGAEWLAMGGGGRGLPAGLAGSAVPGSDAEMAAALSGFRNVWSAREASGQPNASFSASFGGQDALFGRPLGYVASVSYSTSQEIRKDERRALAVRGGFDGETRAINAFTGETGRQSVLWGGIVNLNLQLGEGSRISFNNTYDRTADNEALRLGGMSEEIGREVDVTRLTYTERSIFSSQLGGDHILGGRHRLDWALTFSGVRRSEPDRSDLVYERVAEGGAPRLLWGGNSRQATRAFSDLSENALNGEANYTLRFGDGVDAATLKLGGMFRRNERGSRQFAYDLVNRNLTDAERQRGAEDIFGGAAFDPANLRVSLRPNVNGGSYAAGETLGAGFAMAEVGLRDNLRVVGGARVEYDRIGVDAVDVSGREIPARLRNTDVLPALAVNWEPTEWQKVRLSATQTLSRPEYRELAPVNYFEAFGGQIVFGNRRLERALVRNFDLRWELYPSAEEFFCRGPLRQGLRQPHRAGAGGEHGAAARLVREHRGRVQLRGGAGGAQRAGLPVRRAGEGDLPHQRHAGEEPDHHRQPRRGGRDQRRPAHDGAGAVRGEHGGELRGCRGDARGHAALQRGGRADRGGGRRRHSRRVRAAARGAGLFGAVAAASGDEPEAGRREPAGHRVRGAAGRGDPPPLYHRPHLLAGGDGAAVGGIRWFDFGR